VCVFHLLILSQLVWLVLLFLLVNLRRSLQFIAWRWTCIFASSAFHQLFWMEPKGRGSIQLNARVLYLSPCFIASRVLKPTQRKQRGRQTIRSKFDLHYAARHDTTRHDTAWQNILVWFWYARIHTIRSATGKDKDRKRQCHWDWQKRMFRLSVNCR
jgi:hypothetical protein